MPNTLLTDEEKAERARLEYPRILQYKFFFDNGGWGKAQTDAQPEDWKDDIILAHVQKGAADALMRERIEANFDDGSENAATASLPISQVRAMYKAAGANYDDVPDEAIAALIGRKV